jgi:hypothetical protein
MMLTTISPVWMKNYAPGYIGFQYWDDSILSKGIAYFERWERLSLIKVSHCFVVSGEHECIEALGRGVVTSPLTERFDAPHCAVFFRQPVGWDLDLGLRIVDEARAQLGKGYDYTLVAGHLVTDSWVVNRILSKHTAESFKAWVLKHANGKGTFDCSELSAYCLDSQPELKDRGCLANPDYWIEPQELFEDNMVFQVWKNQT